MCVQTLSFESVTSSPLTTNGKPVSHRLLTVSPRWYSVIQDKRSFKVNWTICFCPKYLPRQTSVQLWKHDGWLLWQLSRSSLMLLLFAVNCCFVFSAWNSSKKTRRLIMKVSVAQHKLCRIFDTARVVCRRVYVMVWCPSVRLSVAVAACGGLLLWAAGLVVSIYSVTTA